MCCSMSDGCMQMDTKGRLLWAKHTSQDSIIGQSNKVWLFLNAQSTLQRPVIFALIYTVKNVGYFNHISVTSVAWLRTVHKLWSSKNVSKQVFGRPWNQNVEELLL